MILGIDPGTTESAFAVVTADYSVHQAHKLINAELLTILKRISYADAVAVESMQSYGQIVGRAIFETCFMIGRILQVCDDRGLPVFLYPRPEYARSLCGSQKINDAILRRALLMRFGGDKKGEPLNELRGETDKRSAFAVAVYHMDLERIKKGSRISPAPL